MQTAGPVLIACCLLAAPASGRVAQPAAPPIMLASVYQGEVDLSDYWVSEKYDGVRAYWNGQQLITRAGHQIHAPKWFTDGWPDMPLDGELWLGRGRFEALASIVRDRRPDEHAWRDVRFMAFDLPAHSGSFTQRLSELDGLLARHGNAWIQPVTQLRLCDRAALEAKLQDVLAIGGEGLMLHRGPALYRATRSDDLLKLKPLADAEARVIAHLPGQGKYIDMMGALLVERPDGLQFRLGSGFSDEERRRPPVLGSWVTYSYSGLTERGVPRFARFVRVREAGL